MYTLLLTGWNMQQIVPIYWNQLKANFLLEMKHSHDNCKTTETVAFEKNKVT